MPITANDVLRTLAGPLLWIALLLLVAGSEAHGDGDADRPGAGTSAASWSEPGSPGDGALPGRDARLPLLGVDAGRPGGQVIPDLVEGDDPNPGLR